MAILGAAPKHHLHARPRVSLRWPRSLTGPFLLFLIITGFYWKLVLTYQYDWLWGPDLTDQVLPWWEEEARQLQHSHFPLWDPHNWLGQSLLGQAQPGAAYPLNWILWLMPRLHGHIQMWAIQWYYVVIHYMAALFCYLLCRDLKRSRTASMIAGLAFGLLGYVGWTDWPQMVNGAVWTPLIFLFLLRAARGRRPWASAVLSGVCLGMSWLSGHHQVPIFLTLASAGVWLYYILKDRRPNLRMAALAALAIVAAPIVGALQILPAQEYGNLALRWVGTPEPLGWQDVVPYYIHTQHQLFPIYLFGILIPGYDHNAGPFFGVVALSLAIVGIAFYWRRHAVKLFSAIAAGGLLYALGGHTVFGGLIYAVVPFVEKARVPAMATLLFHAGFAIVAAFGVDALRHGFHEVEDSPWLRRVNIALFVFGALVGTIALAILLSHAYQWPTDDRVMITVLAAFLMAALLYAFRMRTINERPALVLLILLLLFEAGNESNYMLSPRAEWGQHNFIEKAWGNADIAGFLHRQPGTFRVDTATEDIVPNWGDYYNLDFVQAQAGVTANAFTLETHTPQTKRLLGVKYVLGKQPNQPGQTEVFRGASNIVVYQNPSAFPRAWAVHEIVPIHNKNEGRAFINDHIDDLTAKAMMTTPGPKLAVCPGTSDQASITRYSAESVTIDAEMACDGMLVLSDNYYPGWSATVDGHPSDIYEVDLALRGVAVPAGSHKIVFHYRPRSFVLGFALTLTGLLGAAAITIFSRKKAPLVEDEE